MSASSSPHRASSDVSRSTGTTIVDLPAQMAGDIRFTCGMGRYRGHIQLVDGRTQPARAWLRARAAGGEDPLRTALVIWMCSLPFVALLAALGMGVGAALAAAGVGLVTSVVGCLWAFPGSRRSEMGEARAVRHRH